MVIPNPGLFVAPWIKQANFIRDLEQHLRPESAVLQLPFVRFPESPAIGTMMLYEQIQPYIQSDRLKWSYPNMDGRPGAEWMASLCSRPLEELLQSAVASGFSAIYITMAGYPDGGASLITALRNLLQAEPLRSPDGRNAVFLIANYGSRLKASLGDRGWRQFVSQLGPPQVLLSWGQGFYTSESGGSKTWRWARAHAAIRVLNRTGRNATVPLSMRIYASFGQPRPASVEISGDSLDDRFQATEAGVVRTVILHLHPGTNEVKFDTNGTKVVAPQDPRDMHMRVEEVHLGPIS